MDNNHKEQAASLQVNLKPEVASGMYANIVLINHSQSEFVVDFAQTLPGLPKPDVVSRVILSPDNAKRLLAALEENIRTYEREHGPIELGPSASRVIGPFGPNKGEA